MLDGNALAGFWSIYSLHESGRRVSTLDCPLDFRSLLSTIHIQEAHAMLKRIFFPVLVSLLGAAVSSLCA
jgi:hypothetical protein